MGPLSRHVAVCVILVSAPAEAQDAQPPLKDLARAHGRWIGTAVAYNPLQNDEAYQGFLAAQFDAATPENAMKFKNIHPRSGPGTSGYDFAQADAIANFAQDHGMRLRGHTLVWHIEVPDWVSSGGFSRDQLAAVLQDHIKTVVGRYRGRVYSWDVVNEAVLDDGSLRPTIWSTLGPDYVADAFRWAHAADPDARLFYNDYGAESSPAKADAIFALVSKLKAEGAPIDGVGLQFHMGLGRQYGDFGALIKRFATLGLEVHVTEADVNVYGGPSAAQLGQQADLYASALKACLAEPACTTYMVWGFSDKYCWRAKFFPDILDADLKPKPALSALTQALK